MCVQPAIRWFTIGACLASTAGQLGCDRSPRRVEAATVVDSVVPREVALARFREGLAEPESLTGGAPTREALVRSFARALEAGDTAALMAMALTRAEFAYLYYPTTPQGLPPYDLSPSLMWFTLEAGSRRGLARLLDQRAGHPLRYLSHTCDPSVSVEGENRVVGPCLIRHRDATGAVREERLFGLILERGGRFKFVSYANKLD
jgi:hypothetical protein